MNENGGGKEEKNALFALPGQINQALNPDTQAEEEEERLVGRQSELDGHTERKERIQR